MDYQALQEKISPVIKECGNIMKNADRQKSYVEAKEGRANLVTIYDKMIQQKLQHDLLEIMPEATFVGEEEDIHASIEKGYAFIVDPIDGTTNFIKDYHMSCTSIGLTLDGQPVLGMIYNPYLDELYTAIYGQGAFCNGEPIHVSDAPLSDGIAVVGTAPYCADLIPESFERIRYFFDHSLDIRRSGSAALDLCAVAAGRAEAFFEMRLAPWDFAAGALIVKEAGGIVTQVNGEPLTYDRPCSLLAQNKADSF